MDKNFYQRLCTGIVFIALLVSCITLSQWSFAGLFLLLIILGLLEFYKLIKNTGAMPQTFLGVLLGASLFLFVFFAKNRTSFPSVNIEKYLFSILYFIPFLLFFIELFRKKELPFLNIAYTILGWLYIALPFALWNIILFKMSDSKSEVMYNFHPLLAFFIIMWTTDTMAYVCGKIFGKHKLVERISPKKTWEGFVGGTLFALLSGFIISIFYHDLNTMHWIILAGIIAITGTLGDLVESMFKRSIGVKDSGKIFPGHGGILDRFDSFLLSTPFVVVYYWIFAL